MHITKHSSPIHSLLAILAGCSLMTWGVGCPNDGGQDVAGSTVMRAVELVGTTETCVTLFAGQTIDVGTVCVETDNTVDTSAQCGAGATGALIVTYETTGDWGLVEVHLAVGDDPSDIPTNNAGNPQIGAFPYSATGLGGATSYSCRFASSASTAPTRHAIRWSPTWRRMRWCTPAAVDKRRPGETALASTIRAAGPPTSTRSCTARTTAMTPRMVATALRTAPTVSAKTSRSEPGCFHWMDSRR